MASQGTSLLAIARELDTGAGCQCYDGRLAVDISNTRWCSDGLEIACDSGEKVHVAFALDCCDREAMEYVATTAGISAADVRDLMLLSVEHRLGQASGRAEPIE